MKEHGMKEHGMKTHGLQRRLVAAFALFALASALCLSVFGLVFVYTVEDSFFDNMLAQESAHQHDSWSSAAILAAPLRANVKLHQQLATLPPDLAPQLAVGARGGEFSGHQGRHYHVRRLELAGRRDPVYLVAEVSAELVVRPRLPFIVSVLGGSMLLMLALTIGIGYVLARRATAPLRALAQLVSAAQPAHLPQRFAQQFPDNEIGVLAQQLEQALIRVADFIERERHFSRDASHELRTPLAVIDGAAQLLAAQPLSPQAAEQLQRIRAAVAHMHQAVTALLALAREELAGQAGTETLALLPLVESAVLQQAHLLEGKPVEVLVQIAPDLTVTVEPALLAILLANLIGNAFLHTAQGRVVIGVEHGCLFVQDSGPGIAEQVQARLYQAGARGPASQGHGLGLSIARRLAERGGMTLAHRSDGAGTRAELTLDLASEPVAKRC